MTRAIRFVVHNIIIHPLCGAFWFLGLNNIADRLHDGAPPMTSTPPNPDTAQANGQVALPRPACSFADHSFPAFTERQMLEYGAACVAALSTPPPASGDRASLGTGYGPTGGVCEPINPMNASGDRPADGAVGVSAEEWEHGTLEQLAEICNLDGPLSRGQLHPWDFYKALRDLQPVRSTVPPQEGGSKSPIYRCEHCGACFFNRTEIDGHLAAGHIQEGGSAGALRVRTWGIAWGDGVQRPAVMITFTRDLNPDTDHETLAQAQAAFSAALTPAKQEAPGAVPPLSGEVEALRRALAPLALLAPSMGSGVLMSDPLSEWFTIAQFCNAQKALAALPTAGAKAEDVKAQDSDPGRVRLQQPSGAQVGPASSAPPWQPASTEALTELLVRVSDWNKFPCALPADLASDIFHALATGEATGGWRIPEWNDLTNEQRVAICDEGERWVFDVHLERDAACAIYRVIKDQVCPPPETAVAGGAE